MSGPLGTGSGGGGGSSGGSGGTSSAVFPFIDRPLGGGAGISYGTPGSSAVGDSASAGTASTLALSDHRHGREAFGTPGAVTGGATAASGSASTLARSDHVHSTAGMPVLLASTTLSSAASSISVTSIPQTFKTLRILWSARSTLATLNQYGYLRFNNDSNARYYRWNEAVATEFYPGSNPGTTNWFTGFPYNELVIMDYTSTLHKNFYNRYNYNASTTGANFAPSDTTGVFISSSAISSVQFYGDLAIGSFVYVYGS